jgi:hypothetical protein
MTSAYTSQQAKRLNASEVAITDFMALTPCVWQGKYDKDFSDNCKVRVFSRRREALYLLKRVDGVVLRREENRTRRKGPRPEQGRRG